MNVWNIHLITVWKIHLIQTRQGAKLLFVNVNLLVILKHLTCI